MVLYRIETAKEDLKSAKLLRDADIYKGASEKEGNIIVES